VNLEEFIKSQIKSMAELRTLLFFHTFPQTDWDVMEVAQKLFLQPPVVVAVVTELVSKGFVISVGAPSRYRYQPQSAALADRVMQLAEMDRFHPVTLVNLIAPLHWTLSHELPLSSSPIVKRNL